MINFKLIVSKNEINENEFAEPKPEPERYFKRFDSLLKSC